MKRKEQKWSLGDHPFYEDRNPTVDWASFDFEKINDQRARTGFRLSCKDFSVIYLTDIIGIGLAPSPGTLGNRIRLLRRLVRWMIENQIYSFADITSGRMVDFLTAQLAEKSLTKKHIGKYLHVFEKLWSYRGLYPSPLAVDPSKVTLLHEILEKGNDTKRWTPIPIEEATILIRDSLFFLEEYGEIGLGLLRDIGRMRGTLRGLTHLQMRKRARYAYETVGAMELYQTLRRDIDQNRNLNIREQLRDLIRLILGSALIVILFFTGMRCSEVLALKVGCYYQRCHKSGTMYWYVGGTQAKSGGLDKEWVAPAPVIRVLALLENLHILLMGDVENEYLFAMPDGNGILPPPYVNVRRLWSSSVSDLIKQFATSSLRTGPHLPSIHPHQARKTFARFVVLRDKTGLESLAQHYGHLYTALLDGAYVGIDVELHQLLSQEIEQQVELGLTELMTAKTFGGKAGEAFSKMRNEIAERFRGHATLTTLVKSLIKEGVVLSPCDWGYCLYSVESSACGGTERGPDLRTREPNICSSCTNFVVTERNRQWWEDRLKREEKFLASPDPSKQAFEIAKRRYEKSREVLISLNRVEQNG